MTTPVFSEDFLKNPALYQATTGLCMPKCDYVWLHMTVYDFVSLCMSMYDYVWLCMTMYDYVWLWKIEREQEQFINFFILLQTLSNY